MNSRQRRQLKRLQANGASQSLHLCGDAAVEFKAEADNGSGEKIPSFTMNAYSGGKMQPQGYSRPVVVDLASASVMSGPRPILLNHDPSKIVGHTPDVTIEAKGIRIDSGVLSGAGPAAEEVRASAKRGFPWRASIGSTIGNLESVERGEQVNVNGQKFNGPLFVARGVVIHEVSFVPIAGDNRTSARVAASGSLGAEQMNDFEKWLKANGYEDFSVLTDAQKKPLKAAFDAEAKAKLDATADDDNEPTEAERIVARRKAEADESKRIASIRKLCAGAADVTFKAEGAKPEEVGEPLEAHAIAEGWDAKETELYILKAKRPTPQPGIHVRSHEKDCTIQAMQGALLLRAGVNLDNKHFRPSMQAAALKLPAWMQANVNDEQRQKHMEASHRYSSLSMIDVAREAVRLDGKEIPLDRSELIQAAFGSSGSTLTNLFSTNVNAVLLSAYMSFMDTSRFWTMEVDCDNYKTQERIQIDKGGGMAKLPRGSEADHYTLADRVETYKIAAYARQFVVDEQDMIDDRQDGISRFPKEMGEAAARLRPDLVYALVIRNAALGVDSVALFHADHSNLNTSAGFSATTLKTAIAALEKQRRNSVNLDLRATHLLVPSDLKHLANELVSSSTILYGGDDEAVRGTMNTLAAVENIVPIAEPRLSNGVNDPVDDASQSGSTSTWYLVDNRAPGIEVGYLRGTGRAPQVRSGTLDQGKWGMWWDVKHSIGAKALDFIFGQKNTA